jgi:hypothetical protein
MVIIEGSDDGSLTNSIEYEVFINSYVGLYFEKEFVVDLNNDLITKVELVPLAEVKVEPCKLKVIFHLARPYAKNTFLPAADEFMNIILDYLAFNYGISVKSMRYLDGIYLSYDFVGTHGFTSKQISIMEAELPMCKSEPYKRLYRAALQNVDPVARYMFLYSILFDVLEAENQWGQSTVDSFIRKHCKEVYERKEDKKSNRPPKNNKQPRMETIYTWLRNQVGHTQTNSEIVGIAKMIEEKLGDFEIIVKKAIKQRKVS